MPQYLVAIHHPDDYDPSVEGEAMSRDIHALNHEMVAAGVRIFVGGLSPARRAKSLRAQPDGKVLITEISIFLQDRFSQDCSACITFGGFR